MQKNSKINEKKMIVFCLLKDFLYFCWEVKLKS